MHPKIAKLFWLTLLLSDLFTFPNNLESVLITSLITEFSAKISVILALSLEKKLDKVICILDNSVVQMRIELS